MNTKAGCTQNVVKAAWNIFGDSYRYRQAYNAYKEQRKAEEKAKKQAEKNSKQQMTRRC